MKVILKEHIEGVGHLGDVMEVSDGFARNFLLPRKKALEASPRNVKEFEHATRLLAEKARKEKVELEAHARKISAVSLTITMKAGKDGKLFGSVTSKDIEEGLAEKGVTIDRKKIQLTQPIKALGTVTVPIKLHRDVTATVSVEVVKLQEEETASHEAPESHGSHAAHEAHETHEKPAKKAKAEKKEKKEKKA
jgi:large subunit ribosomal protein L9